MNKQKKREMTLMQQQKNNNNDAAQTGPMQIMLVSRERERMAPLASGLWTLAETEIHQASSQIEALDLLKEKEIELVVIDEQLTDMSGIDLAKMVARQHPFVNCILVDTQSPEAFHEQTEGLGLLMQLSSPPEMADAKSIMTHLAAIGASR